MKLSLLSHEKIVFQGNIRSVTLPGLAGELTVLEDHVPLITPLKKGKITIQDEDSKEFIFDIEKGVLEVQPKETTVLVTGEVFLYCQAGELEKK
ncbi:MAG: ATP synthase F1 subunit epsilon [Candidatus Paceibacterota bacterium]|jgi:F-type H+-transporting ATPase subunit epsilon